jgi:hypothetical protein
MRASVVEPIPSEIPYTDWWFAARAALVSDIAYVPEPRTLYRFHGGNITLGVAGAARARELRKPQTFVRWFLRRMEPGATSARGIATAWTYFEYCERELAALGEAGVEVGEEDRSAGAIPERDLTALLRAAAADPTSHTARDGLADALAAALPADAAALDGAGPRVVLAFADELVAAPHLLDAWARGMRGVPGVTLAVTTSPEATDALAQAAAGLPDDVDVLAVVGPVDRDAVSAVYSERGRDDPPAPRFGAADLVRLAAAWS